MLGWLEGGRHFLLSSVWKKYPPQLGLGLRSTLGGNNLYKPQIPEPKVFLGLYHPNIIPFLLSFFFFFFFSSFLFRVPIYSLAIESWSLVWRSYWHWVSFCLSAPSKATSTLFFSLIASVSLALRSLTLYLARVKASTVAMHRPSSSFICRWELFTSSSAICVA